MDEEQTQPFDPDDWRQVWRHKLRQWLQAWKADPRIRRRAAWIVCLLVAAITGRRYRRRLAGFLLLSSNNTLSSSRFQRPDYLSAQESPLSHLLEAIRNGLVQKVLLGGSVMYYRSKDSSWQRTQLPPNNAQIASDVLDKLSRAGCADIQALPESLLSRLSGPFLTALPFVYLGLLYRMVKHFSNQHSEVSSSTSADRCLPSTTFADVAGLDDILPEVSEIVDYLRNPSAFSAVGARPPRGILLYGPSGVGKTLLARAVAGEAGVDAFLACNASEFVEVYVGRGAARVRSLFAKLRQQARAASGTVGWNRWWKHLPAMTTTTTTVPRQRSMTAILFVDELDALAKTRSVLSSNDEREQTLMQLLTEMDGFASNGTQEQDVQVVVLAATNRADILDPAILRRFDRQIHVGYPDVEGREAILRIHAKRIALVDGVDWGHLADRTVGFSGSDLRNVVNEAALLAVRQGQPAVEQHNLGEAVRKIGASKSANPTDSPHRVRTPLRPPWTT